MTFACGRTTIRASRTWTPTTGAPRINAYGGRDHWPHCGSALLAGCGVPGGAVIGTSDNHGAYPATRPVNVTELAATVYRLMGINTNTDLRIRPFLGDAAPMAE